MEMNVKRTYKDVLFRMIFRGKKELLSLYNAVNGTDHTNEDDLTIVTLEDAIYMNVKNDIAFLMRTSLNLYEHQSSVNPNMPLRDLLYISKEYSGITERRSLYSGVLQKIPTPRFVVFYNGKEEQPEQAEIFLSDAFQVWEEHPQLELRVTVLNINYGKNRELMKQCRTLEEYAIFVDRLRELAKKMSIEEAAVQTVDTCIRDHILEAFLRRHRAEVIEVSIFYYDEEKELKLIREDEFEQGRLAGLAEGKVEGERIGKCGAILELLSELGAVPEEVKSRICAEQNADTLKNWTRLAARAENLEEFLTQFSDEEKAAKAEESAE